jgi:hypothetical protein
MSLRSAYSTKETERSPELWKRGKRYAFPAFPQLLLRTKVERINQDTTGKHQPGRSQQPPSRFWRIVKEVFEVVSFVAVIATMIFVGLQWREMGRQYAVMAKQLAEMHTTGKDTHTLAQQTTTLAEQTKSLASSAKTSADAAKTSADNSDRIARGSEAAVKTAQSSIRLDQRAWISISKIEGKPKVGEPFRIVVVFHNSGRTPANIKWATMVADPVLNGGQPTFTYNDMPHVRGVLIAPNGDHHGTIVPTRQTSDSSKEAPMTQGLIDAIEAGSMRLFIHGVVHYLDIFRQEHCFRFCSYYDNPGWTSCEMHNDTQCVD